MDHYWNSDIGESFHPELFSFVFENRSFTMYSSSSVFSSFKADEGSLILASCLREGITSYLSGRSPEEKLQFRALDVGCGYGLLSILLAELIPAYRGDMIDVSQRAIKLAQMNVQKFQKEERLRVFESDKYQNVRERYDIVYTNPPIRTGKANVHAILEGAGEVLKPNGELYVVIRKSHGAPSAAKKMRELYGSCEIWKRSKGYYVLYAKRS
ncbi:MAG: methyltransferase [Bacillota bacterium]|nr:methyltransferase [Bacillota bacterium]